jgi:hypothetical protein
VQLNAAELTTAPLWLDYAICSRVCDLRINRRNDHERKGLGHYLGLLSILAATATISPGMAQDQPPPAAPSTQGKNLEGCNLPRANVSTASMVQATSESLQRKRWQPQGGVIQFTIKSFAAIPDKASFFVCYRWKTAIKEDREIFKQVRPDRLERTDGTTWTVTTTIPSDLPIVPSGTVVESALPLVPLADVRVIAVAEGNTLAADATARGRPLTPTLSP